MTKADYDDFIKKMTEVENCIAEKQKPEIEARERNANAWKLAERRISKIQGEKRSNGWSVCKFYSTTFSPVSVGMINRIKSEMTEEERRILGL